MQWTLTFLEVPPPEPQPRDQNFDDEVLKRALSILVRVLAQSSEPATQKGTADE
jgi:hypothetical protein